MTPVPAPLVVALHLGAMHPIEKWLTVVLAFGPFLVLAVVVVVRRRQEAGQEECQEPCQEQRQGGDDAPAHDAQRPR